jgi:hypothetical protein
MNLKDQILEIDEPSIDENTQIYRVFSSHWLNDMFATKKFSLSAPHKWDDPAENVMAKNLAKVNGHQNVGLTGVFKNFYGQCWTLNPESDAMWRIYSPSKDGARVRTTVGRLLSAIHDPMNTFASMSYFIGRVAYRDQAGFKKFFEEHGSTMTFDPTGRAQAYQLLMKREAFTHEQEVRLLFRYAKENDDNQRAEEYWPFAIDPNTLFDDVLFDPRMDDAAFTASEKLLRGQGYKSPIDRSTLYQIPKLDLDLNFGQ